MTSDRRGGSLVVVSNRLPYNLPPAGRVEEPVRNVGGLVNALEPVLEARGGVWVGWDGIPRDSQEPSEVDGGGTAAVTAGGVTLHGVPLSRLEVKRYYHGLSNSTLWPLFHSITDKAVFDAGDFDAYVKVNRRFAEAVLAHVSERDRVWVHDYHLMLLPRMLRELGFTGRVDYFLHIPFPPPEIFLTLPWRDRLIDGLLAADTIGVHVEGYRRNLLRTARQLARGEVEQLGTGRLALTTDERRTMVGVAPIGVEIEEFERIAELPATAQRVARIRKALDERKILLSADRLDYTKGVRERLLAVERYLRQNPSAARTFTFVQVVVPSRNQVAEYHALKREIDEEVGRINGECGLEGWLPIHYRYRALNREELVAYYRAASAALVTPLRDGLNLVAPEFVASRTDRDGVLVLSEFAGIAGQLSDAVLVNPHDIDACAAAIRTALEMDPAERTFRMTRMLEAVRANDLSRWSERCLALGDPAPGHAWGKARSGRS